MLNCFVISNIMPAFSKILKSAFATFKKIYMKMYVFERMALICLSSMYVCVYLYPDIPN